MAVTHSKPGVGNVGLELPMVLKPYVSLELSVVLKPHVTLEKGWVIWKKYDITILS